MATYSLLKLRFLFSPRNPSSAIYGDYITWIQDNLPEMKPQNILDVGAGYGIFTRITQKKFRPKLMVSVDTDYAALKQINAEEDEIETVIADAENLPFRDSAFELVYSISLLEHLEHPEKSIEEHLRVTRNFVSFQIPNLRYWIEIHTMVPLLGFMPKIIRDILSEKSGPFKINWRMSLGCC